MQSKARIVGALTQELLDLHLDPALKFEVRASNFDTVRNLAAPEPITNIERRAGHMDTESTIPNRLTAPEYPPALLNIEQRILLVRGHKVMLSSDLAALYEVEPKVLNQAVKRNLERFPEDFMFQLTPEENANLKSQIVTSSWGGARRAMPYAFTEQGVAMLSSVLHSPRAIQVNIAVMRAFVKLRDILSSNRELSRKLDAMERKYDVQFRAVFDAIRELMKPPEKPRPKIGF